MAWNLLGQKFCSYKVHMRNDKTHRLCKNPYNQTGICSRVTCPLANSQYATIIEYEDELYLYVKTAERAHTPRRMWEKVKLSSEFKAALTQIDQELQWWDRRHVLKVKARLLRLKQYLMRKQRMLTETEEKYESVNKRQEHKLQRREAKAERAARIELDIEKELLDRLRKGTYDSILNYNPEVFDKILNAEGVEDVEEMSTQNSLPSYVIEDEAEELDIPNEEIINNPKKAKRIKRKRIKVVIEKEMDQEPLPEIEDNLSW